MTTKKGAPRLSSDKYLDYLINNSSFYNGNTRRNEIKIRKRTIEKIKNR